jgi:hypothetical protein
LDLRNGAGRFYEVRNGAKYSLELGNEGESFLCGEKKWSKVPGVEEWSRVFLWGKKWSKVFPGVEEWKRMFLGGKKWSKVFPEIWEMEQGVPMR